MREVLGEADFERREVEWRDSSVGTLRFRGEYLSAVV